MARALKVALVDDDEAVLDSLGSLLAKRGLSAASMTSAEALLIALDDAAEFGCIVSDIKMPTLSGHELLDELKARGVATPVIFITGHGGVDLAVRSMKSGICDFIEKPIDGARFVASVRDALQRYDDIKAAEAALGVIRQRYAALSDRQREVMRLASTGHPNKEIAQVLKLSPRTVEHYREWVMGKMQARNLADLVHMAVRLGLLDTPGRTRGNPENDLPEIG